MKSIKFIAAYGDEEREVTISQVSGSLNGIHIYVDDYYVGSVANVFGEWTVHWVVPGPKSAYQYQYVMDDTDAILDQLRIAEWID